MTKPGGGATHAASQQDTSFPHAGGAGVAGSPRAARHLLGISRACFSVSVLLLLLTPSWELAQGSLLARWPIAWVAVGSRSYPVGLLVGVPAAAGLSWLLARLLERPRRAWNWGPRYVTVPLAAFGVLILGRAAFVASPQHQVEAVLAVGLLWGVYLYVLQDWPAPWAVGTLGGVTLVQGLVATGQFLSQRSLGLAFLGESVLNPQTSGACVIESGGLRWLRAYGLTPHPDVLGGYLAMGILVCLGALLSARGWRRPALVLCLAVGGLGLFFSFSRSAWLGTLTGLLFLAFAAHPWQQVSGRSGPSRRTLLFGLVALVLAGAVLGVVYGGLLAARIVRLDEPLERRSLLDRQTDLGQAWALVREAPLVGVGPGRYLDALWERAGTHPPPGFRRVYNVPLLAAAELGIPGALLWLWIVLALPVTMMLPARQGAISALGISWAAGLVAIVLIAMFHYYFYMLPGWWYSLYPTLLLGLAGAARGESCA